MRLFVSAVALAIAAAGPLATQGTEAKAWLSRQPVTVNRITDGDTLQLNGGARVRLSVIDAPELRQQCRTADGRSWPCGRQAAQLLRELVKGGSVECGIIGLDRYGRSLAHCWAAGRHVGRSMISAGYAVPYGPDPRAWLSSVTAWSNGAGIWSGSFVWPSTYRQQQR